MKSEPMEIDGRRFQQPPDADRKSPRAAGSGTEEILVLLSLQ